MAEGLGEGTPRQKAAGGHCPSIRELDQVPGVTTVWYRLGLQLGVSTDELDKIENNYPRDADMRKVKMFAEWQRSDTNPTYEKLVRALARVGRRKLAESVCRAQSISSSVLGVTDAVPVYQSHEEMEYDAVAAAKINIGYLQSEYELLVRMTLIAVKAKSTTLDEFRTKITLQLPEPRPEQETSLRKKLRFIYDAESIDEIFGIFNLYRLWNYLNFGLLQHLVEVYGDDELQQRILKYTTSVELFRKQTTLKVFWKASPATGMCPEIPTKFRESLKRITFKHGNLHADANLEDIQKYRQDFAKQYSFPELTIILADIEKGCVATIWLVPSSLATKLADESKRGNVSFLKRHSILELKIQDSTVYHSAVSSAMDEEGQLAVMEQKPVYKSEQTQTDRMAVFHHQNYRFELQGIKATGKEIGRGSYAVVEEFYFRGLSCAGKSIHQELKPGQQGNILERFVEECEILSQLRHPNVVQFLGVHQKNESQLPVLIMERMYCTLSSCIDDHGILPDESNYSILHNIALGLNYLHHYFPSPIVHRDLSANNVLLTSDLSAKISDLGVARILNQPMSKMTACPGTPPYMPPEVFLDEPNYSTKVDSFSYGVLMLHMFCGRWPFPLADRYVDPHDRTKYIHRTEIERRQPFFSDIPATHPLLPLMRECLSDHPDTRPDVSVVLTSVRNLASQFPPSFHDRVEMFERINADANEKVVLNERVQELSNENTTLCKKLSAEEQKKQRALYISEDRCSLLYTASKEGHSQVVEFLLSKGANPNFQEENGSTPLSIAAERGYPEVVEKLLRAGASTKCVSKDDETALYFASWKGHSKVVALLVQASADLNQQNKNGSTPIFVASQNGHIQVVEILLNNGANPNIQKENGSTPICVASQNGHAQVVELMLRNGANPDIQTENGSTPIQVASQNGHVQVVKILLNNGTNPNIQTENGSTPIFVASQNGHIQVVEILLDNGANPNIQTENGSTPIFVASQNGHVQVVEILLNNEANPNTQTENGSTALSIATEKSHTKVVELLLRAGANTKLQNKDGETALHYASSNGHKQIVQLLIEADAACVNQQKMDGATPLLAASAKGNKQVVEVLIHKGADSNLQDKHGLTPLICAAKKGYKDVVEILLEAEANPDIEDQEKETAIMNAARCGCTGTVSLLLHYGANTKLTNMDGSSALFIASQHDHIQVAKLLLHKGPDAGLQSQEQLQAEPEAGQSFADLQARTNPESDTSAADEIITGAIVLHKNWSYLYQHLDTSHILQPLLDSGIVTEDVRKQVQSYVPKYAQNIVLVRNLFHTKPTERVLFLVRSLFCTKPTDRVLHMLLAETGQEHIRQKLTEDYKHQRSLLLSGQQSQPTATSKSHSSDFSDLSELFLQTLRNVFGAFEQESNTLNMLKSVLSLLVLPLGDSKVVALVEPSAYADAQTIQDLARLLAPYWNCVSTDLLQLFVEESGNSLAVARVKEFISARKMRADLVLAAQPSTTTSNWDGSGLSPGHTLAHSSSLQELQSQQPAVFARLPEHCASTLQNAVRVSVEIAIAALHIAEYDCITLAVSAFFGLPCAALVYCGCSQNQLIVCWEISSELLAYIRSVDPGQSSYRLLAEQGITGLAVADEIKFRCPSIKEVKLMESSFYGLADRIPDLLICGNVDVLDLDGATPLFIASQNGHSQVAELLLSKGADVNLPEQNGATPLFMASQKGNSQVAELLLSKGADVNLPNKDGITPLYVASLNGHSQVAEVLLSKGACVNLPNKDGATPLLIASENGHSQVAELLLSKGADINRPDKGGYTPLLIASQNGHSQVAELLLSKGADVNLPNQNGATPLFIASQNGHSQVAELLLSKGANVNLPKKGGYTPLLIASQNGHSQVAELLLSKGADVNLPNQDGATPLFAASQNGHSQVAELLLGKGADVNLPMKNGHSQVAELLFSKGADINLSNQGGFTPLYVASHNGHSQVAELLLGKGADINLSNQNGATPLYIASQQGHSQVAELLLSKGADVHLPEQNGATPLYVASQQGHSQVAELLLSKGADVNLRMKDQTTALMTAAKAGHSRVVATLLHYGANVKITNRAGLTALDMASTAGRTEVCQELLNHSS